MSELTLDQGNLLFYEMILIKELLRFVAWRSYSSRLYAQILVNIYNFIYNCCVKCANNAYGDHSDPLLIDFMILQKIIFDHNILLLPYIQVGN